MGVLLVASFYGVRTPPNQFAWCRVWCAFYWSRRSTASASLQTSLRGAGCGGHSIGRAVLRRPQASEPVCVVQGVVGILLVAPYYGVRKPPNQFAWYLRSYHDILVQSVTLGVEGAALLHWAKQAFRVPLAVTGISFGGGMAALAATLYPGSLAVVPYMGCPSPTYVFTCGVLPRYSYNGWSVTSSTFLEAWPRLQLRRRCARGRWQSCPTWAARRQRTCSLAVCYSLALYSYNGGIWPEKRNSSTCSRAVCSPPYISA